MWSLAARQAFAGWIHVQLRILLNEIKLIPLDIVSGGKEIKFSPAAESVTLI